jgi:hypothetical protein
VLFSSITLYPTEETAVPLEINAYTELKLHREYWREDGKGNAALQGCRATAKTNGIGKLAKQCKIVSRAPKPGYGTIVCGVDGCSWGMAFGSAQEAIDAIYADCAKSYTDCRDKDINFWEDRAGFATGTAVSAPISGDCRPRTNTLQCSSSCNNGSGVVRYENGCQMRVQVQPRFNGFNNQWEYPAPSC